QEAGQANTPTVQKATDTLIYRSSGVELEMKKGHFDFDRSSAWQLITVTNHSTVAIRWATVECGFFHGDLLIGRDTSMVSDLQPGQDGYIKSSAYVLSADRTSCRFTDVHR